MGNGPLKHFGWTNSYISWGYEKIMNVEKTCGSFGKEIIEDFNGIEFPILRDALEP